MRLLDELRKFLAPEHLLARDKSGAPADIELQAATALLLLEAAHGDEVYEWREHRAIVGGLKRAFGLGRAEALELLERAEEIRPPSVRLSDVADVIVERYDHSQRTEIVRLLWETVDADEIMEGWEEIFAAHVARTVGLTDEESLAARQGVRRVH